MAIPGTSGASPWGYGSGYDVTDNISDYTQREEENPFVEDGISETTVPDSEADADRIRVAALKQKQEAFLKETQEKDSWTATITNRENKAGQTNNKHNGLSYEIMDRIEALRIAGIIYDRNDRDGEDNHFHKVDKQTFAKELEKIHKEHRYKTNWGTMQENQSFTYNYNDLLRLIDAAGYSFKEEDGNLNPAQPKMPVEPDPLPKAPDPEKPVAPVPTMEVSTPAVTQTADEVDDGVDVLIKFSEEDITDSDGNTTTVYDKAKFYNPATGKWEPYTGNVPLVKKSDSDEATQIVTSTVSTDVPEGDEAVGDDGTPLVVGFASTTVTTSDGDTTTVADATIVDGEQGTVTDYSAVQNGSNFTSSSSVVGTFTPKSTTTPTTPATPTTAAKPGASQDELVARFESDPELAGKSTQERIDILNKRSSNNSSAMYSLKRTYENGYQVVDNKRILGFIGPKTKKVELTDEQKDEIKQNYESLAAQNFENEKAVKYMQLFENRSSRIAGGSYAPASVEDAIKMDKPNEPQQYSVNGVDLKEIPTYSIVEVTPKDGGEPQKVCEVVSPEKSENGQYQVRYYKPEVVYGRGVLNGSTVANDHFMISPDMNQEVTDQFPESYRKYHY